VRRSRIDKDVDELLRDPGNCHWLTASRIWALMAIGDAFSSRCTLPGQPFPGSRYWARAMQLVHMVMERPRLCLVEVYLLLVSGFVGQHSIYGMNVYLLEYTADGGYRLSMLR
jgi:hypothetical protein